MCSESCLGFLYAVEAFIFSAGDFCILYVYLMQCVCFKIQGSYCSGKSGKFREFWCLVKSMKIPVGKLGTYGENKH